MLLFENSFIQIIIGLCPAGGYCDGKELTRCPSGTYNKFNGSSYRSKCISCPAGYYCLGPGVIDYESFPCKAGYFCPEATRSASEFPCPTGTYNSVTKATSHSACLPCSVGGYCESGSASVTPCPRGYYCPESTGAGTSFACPIGTYSGALGLENATQCIDCPVGNFCPDGSNLEPTISPTPCPPGTYNNETKSGHRLNCRPCDAGRSCPNSESSSSTHSCQIGHYCPPGTVTSNQFPCLPGTYTNETDLSRPEQCLPCPKSFACGWGTGFPTTPWLPCKQGHYCPEGMMLSFFLRPF